MKVIDISSYQPTVNYAAVAADVDGAVIRAGLRYWGSLHLGKDACFEQHYAGFKAAGVPLGAYFYSAAQTVAEAKAEAAYFAGLLEGKRFELPVYFDVENSQRQGALSKAALTAIVQTFCSVLETYGYFAGYYSYTSWLLSKFDTAALSAYTLWKADYRAVYDQTIACDMHQYTSSGSVNGIATRVDLSTCTRDFPSIIKASHLNGYNDSVLTDVTTDSTGMIFAGRNQVPYGYGCYNYRRSSGSVHRGIDIVGLDDDVIRSTIVGTVRRALIVTGRSDLTWQWGYYVRVDDAKGNKHYFCHMDAGSFKVKVGQRVSVGTPLGVMGNTGNAVYNDPPYRHVHYEVHAAAGGYLNPCGYAHIDNAAGVYGTASVEDIGDAEDKLLCITGTNCEYFAQQSTHAPLGKLGKDTVYAITGMAATLTVVSVGGVTVSGYWIKFRFHADGEEYYCLALSDRAVIQDAPTAGDDLVEVTADTLHVRRAPGTGYGIASDVRKGDKLQVLEQDNTGWGYIQSDTHVGWICLSHTSKATA